MGRWWLVGLGLILVGGRHVPTAVVRLAERVAISVLVHPKHYPGAELRSLDALHPGFRVRLQRTLGRLESQGYTVSVHRTWRDPARQDFYRRMGWSRLSVGYHTICDAEGRPEALAADVAPVGLTTTAARADFWRALLAASRAEGLTTGATWTRSGSWHRDHPDIGWDPGHVQIAGTNLTAVARGWRP